MWCSEAPVTMERWSERSNVAGYAEVERVLSTGIKVLQEARTQIAPALERTKALPMPSDIHIRKLQNSEGTSYMTVR
jgi:hypothetical protein